MSAFKYRELAWPYGLRLDGASSQWLPFPLGDGASTGVIISKFPVGALVIIPVLTISEQKSVLFKCFRVVEKGTKFAFIPHGGGEGNEYFEISIYAFSAIVNKSVEELEEQFRHTFKSLEIIM